ncbi:MAG TPA: hypothetical protein VGO66_00960 [Solirubrobacterales bacterium]|nr:hypothetical protein [Solirubrobacterales bacterium]
MIEKTDAAEQDEAEAVPAVNESHRGFPTALSIGVAVMVQAQSYGLVAGRHGSTAYGMQLLPLVFVQIESKLFRQ